jgi:hypothetical protein
MWTTLFAITVVVALAAMWVAKRMEPAPRKLRSWR